MSSYIANPLKLLEASTGIEPVYTDLQSAASPLRQLAAGAFAWCGRWIANAAGVVQRVLAPLPITSLCGTSVSRHMPLARTTIP